MSESIADKCTKLGELLSEDGRTDDSWRLHREALLDGFLVLFDECGAEHMQKDKHIAAFVNKYKDDVKSLRNTRPSISDFKMISTIGRGHFGQVQVVKEIKTNDVYAMKTLKKSKMLSQENVAFFEEERDIMAYGHYSPWITSLHYAFQDAQNLHLVMEFHPGGDLLTLLGKQENEVLEEKAAQFYLAEIVLALHSLHELGYVHRDVKPDNILIDKHGHIKLADFGSAAKLSITDKKVYSKMAVGTPEYISPEVLTSMEGSGGGYGVECDWWSLGIIAYEMVYGNPPFTGPSVAVTYSKIMSYKESLTFPNDIYGSLSMKSLIKGLLTDIETRFGYEDLIKHAFFKGVTWLSLKNEQPPYIPTISGVDDTSNFDEFDPEEPTSFGSANNLTKKTFSGKDLPFIGFTFTRSNKNLKSAPNCPTDVHVVSKSLGTEQNESTSDGGNERLTLKKMVDELQKLLDTRKGTIESLENEKDLLEKERMLKEIEIKDLKKRLDIERTERNNADNTALKLLTEVETIRKKAHDLRKEETRAVFDEQQDVLTQLEDDRFIAMKRTQRLQDELTAQQKIVEEKSNSLIELQRTVDKLKEQLAKKSDDEIVEEAIVKRQEKEKTDLKKMRERLKEKTDECSELETQLLNSKSLKRKLQKSEEKVAELSKVREKNTTELNQKLSEAEKENRSLNNAIKKMEKEVEETYDASQAAARDFETKEKKFKENEAVISKFNEDLQRSRNETKSTLDKNKELKGELAKLNENLANFKNTQETLNEELKERKIYIEKLQWTAKYTASRQSVEGKNEQDLKNQLEIKSIELKETKSKNKELQENITKLVEKGEAISKMKEELEQELKQKEKLVGSLLKNELTVKAAMKDDETESTESTLNVKNLESEIMSLNYKNSEMENENKELNGQIENLMGKCECLIKTKEELENELKDKIQVIEGLNSTFKPSKEVLLKESIGKDSDEIQDLKAEIVVIDNENKELKDRNKNLKSDLRKLTDEFSGLKDKSKSYNVELDSKTKKLEEYEKTISMLKTTCTMLEGQIEELEILNDELDEKNIQLEIEIKHLLLSNEKYEQARLEQEMAQEDEGISNNEQLDKDKTLIKESGETIAEQGKQLKISELNLKSLERKMEKEVSAKKKLLNEIEQQKCSMDSLETVNSQLSQELQELKERQEEVLSENSSMAEHLETLKSMHAEEKVKLVSTSAQQSKLIDFLQSKAESKASKRKRLGVSNLLSSWKHQDDSNFIPCQWGELQQALEKERASRMQLQNELNKVKEELEDSKEKTTRWKARCHMTPNATVPRSNQSMAILSALQQSPSRQPSPGTAFTPIVGIKRKGSTPGAETHRPKERMHHNIPHRFTVVLNMRATKCPVCLDSILFGRQVSKCTECSVVCHCKCSLSLQHTCGLPSQYVEHFSEALLGPKKETSILGTPGDDVCDGKSQHWQGWLKVPRNGSAKNGWDTKWVVLQDEKLLVSETTDEKDRNDDSSDTLVLSGDEGEVKVHSAVAGSDLVGAAATDLPYVFSIETLPKTTCWPGRRLFLLAPSFPEKQKWVQALEKVVNDPKHTASAQNHQKMNGNLLLRMKGDDCLDINCSAVLNDKFVLLGAEEGLFLLPMVKPGKNNIPRQIPGVRNVFQIHIESDLGLALLISGNERELLCVDIKQLEACTKQSREVPLAPLTFQHVENIINCHLFALKKVEDGTFLCAALPNKISVLRFNSSMNAFVIRKEIDSSEPCSCILFSKSHIIVGSNKFYQIDLRQFTLNDFLDCKDTSLAFAVYHASQANSFPIDSLQVSSPNSSKEEFLLCFNGFGVFVNSSGKRTRKDDLKWTSLPLSFAYQEPYLFVTHFNSIEICKIPAINTENQERICTKFFEIKKPRILGPAMAPAAIYLVSTLTDEIDMLCYQGNLTPILQTVDENKSSSHSEATSGHGRKRLHTATGCENVPPSNSLNSLSAFSRNPKRFLRNSLRF